MHNAYASQAQPVAREGESGGDKGGDAAAVVGVVQSGLCILTSWKGSVLTVTGGRAD